MTSFELKAGCREIVPNNDHPLVRVTFPNFKINRDAWAKISHYLSSVPYCMTGIWWAIRLANTKLRLRTAPTPVDGIRTILYSAGAESRRSLSL